MRATQQEVVGSVTVNVGHTVRVFDSLVLQHSATPVVAPLPFQFPPPPATLPAPDYEHDARTEHVYLSAGGMLLGHAFYAEVSVPEAAATGPVHVFMPMGDTQGSTSFIVDHDSGELVERSTYQPYGAVEIDYRPARWASFREDIRHTGHWDDSQVGLIYFGARYYSPQLARFISPDPLTIHAVSGDLNPYAFVRGAPSRYIDPWGLDDSSNQNDDNSQQSNEDQQGSQSQQQIASEQNGALVFQQDYITGWTDVDQTGQWSSAGGTTAGESPAPSGFAPAHPFRDPSVRDTRFGYSQGGELSPPQPPKSAVGPGCFPRCGDAIGPMGALISFFATGPVLGRFVGMSADVFTVDDVAFGLTRADGRPGALVTFAGDAIPGTRAPLSATTRALPIGAARNAAIANDTIRFAVDTLRQTGGRLRFNLSGFSVSGATTAGSAVFDSVTSAEYRAIMADDFLRARTVFYGTSLP